jgi:hypothetical protein
MKLCSFHRIACHVLNPKNLISVASMKKEALKTQQPVEKVLNQLISKRMT